MELGDSLQARGGEDNKGHCSNAASTQDHFNYGVHPSLYRASLLDQEGQHRSSSKPLV